MTKAFTTFAVLALFCFTASFAQSQNGIVSVAVTNTTYLNGQSIESQQEFVEFDYETVEWNSSEEGNLENEWMYEEAGVGEFELTNQAGDVVVIRARNDNDIANGDLGAILGTLVGSSAVGGVRTVADNIGNSVAAAQQGIQSTSTNTIINNAVNESQAIVNNAGAIVGTVAQDAQNLTQNADQAVAAAGYQAGDAVGNATNYAQNVYNDAANNVNNATQDAAQAAGNATNYAQSVYNDAANNVNNATQDAAEAAQNAGQSVQNAYNSAVNSTQSAYNDAVNNVNNLQENASEAVNNAANSASASLNNAVNSAQSDANAVQNGLNNVQNAYNQGFLSANGQQ